MTDGPRPPQRYAPGMCARPTYPALALAIAFALAAPRTATATVVQALTLEEKCRIAPVIVHAIVERVEAEWEEPGASVQTIITVRVLEPLKGGGEKGARLTIYQGGGQIGEFRQTASGSSSWELGEEAVLFLEPTGPYLVEIGIGIGKYGISSNGKDRWVTHAPHVAGARFERGQPMKIAPIEPIQPVLLPKFLKQVRSLIAGIPLDPPMPRKGASLKVPERKR